MDGVFSTGLVGRLVGMWSGNGRMERLVCSHHVCWIVKLKIVQSYFEPIQPRAEVSLTSCGDKTMRIKAQLSK
jgi:hypothetical protein